MQYRGHSYFYGSIENMMEACVKCQYLHPAAAERLTRRYYKSAGKACVKHAG
jgi:urease accessory protein UreF